MTNERGIPEARVHDAMRLIEKLETEHVLCLEEWVALFAVQDDLALRAHLFERARAVRVDIVGTLRTRFPDCAITVSAGELPRKVYQQLFDAGADRYLLRHETADPHHYGKLHPASMSLEERKACLFALRDIGFQVGSGFLVGAPGQTSETMAANLAFLH